MDNLRKHRGIKLVTTEKRRNYLVLEPNYDSTKFFTETLLVLEIRKTKIVMNKSVNLSLSIKYDGKTKLCFIDTGRIMVYIKITDIYADNPEDVET